MKNPESLGEAVAELARAQLTANKLELALVRQAEVHEKQVSALTLSHHALSTHVMGLTIAVRVIAACTAVADPRVGAECSRQLALIAAGMRNEHRADVADFLVQLSSLVGSAMSAGYVVPATSEPVASASAQSGQQSLEAFQQSVKEMTENLARQVQHGLGDLAAAINAPREVVFDGQGNPVGSRPVAVSAAD